MLEPATFSKKNQYWREKGGGGGAEGRVVSGTTQGHLLLDAFALLCTRVGGKKMTPTTLYGREQAWKRDGMDGQRKADRHVRGLHLISDCEKLWPIYPPAAMIRQERGLFG